MEVRHFGKKIKDDLEGCEKDSISRRQDWKKTRLQEKSYESSCKECAQKIEYNKANLNMFKETCRVHYAVEAESPQLNTLFFLHEFSARATFPLWMCDFRLVFLLEIINVCLIAFGAQFGKFFR